MRATTAWLAGLKAVVRDKEMNSTGESFCGTETGDLLGNMADFGGLGPVVPPPYLLVENQSAMPVMVEESEKHIQVESDLYHHASAASGTSRGPARLSGPGGVGDSATKKPKKQINFG